MQNLIYDFLKKIGENPEREGLKKTPERVEKAWEFLTHGYQKTVKDVIGKGIFTCREKDMVVINNIEFFSLCEHHLLPFYGKVHIGYVPNNKLIGLSKLPRIVELFSRRLQIQERLNREIANAIEEAVNPCGVGVIIEASHLCMMMRGIQKQHSMTITSTMLGLFREDPKTREEFLQLVKR